MKLGVGVLVSLACTLLSSVALALPPVERFAIVIGNNRAEMRAEQASSDLRYADDDALATHRLLVEAGVTSLLLASFDEDSVRMAGALKPYARPRADELERALVLQSAAMRAAAARGAITEFLFFYSGHGDIEGGEGFLVLEDRRLTRSLLFDLLSRSPARQNHVFIDACRSYFVVFERGPGGERKPYGGVIGAAIPARLANTGFVLSTSSDRESHEWERYQGGILSHELRSALRGAADTDLNAQISYAELGAFLTRTNQAIQNPRFRPDFLLRPPGGDLGRAVLGWRPERAKLSFGSRSWGHFYVETARGDRLLDAHPADGQALRLRVPDERPLFVRRNDGQSEYVVVTPASLDVGTLSATPPAVASRGALNLALEELFALPFAESDVLAFRTRHATQDRSNADPADAPTGRRRVKTAMAVVTLAGVGAGLALNGVALGTYLSAADESQERTEKLNERTATFNRAALGCYAAAALAAGVWAWANWWPEGAVSVAPSGGGGARMFDGLVLDVRGGF